MLFSKDFVYKCNASLTCHTLSLFSTVHCKIQFTVKPIVAHGVKADRLSRVFGKIFLKCIILAAYRCIEEDNFDCKLYALPDPVSSLS